jgi:Ala-tRNA(Pro) deacylase
MPCTRLHRMLDANGVKYRSIAHAPAYSAQRIAAVAHVSGRELAKTVIVDIDGELAMVVQTASSRVPLDRVKAAAGARDVRLAREYEFRERFPDCEAGAMPPFGNLFGMEVFVTRALADDEEIAVNAGTHTELIKLRYNDFARLTHPIVV